MAGREVVLEASWSIALITGLLALLRAGPIFLLLPLPWGAWGRLALLGVALVVLGPALLQPAAELVSRSGAAGSPGPMAAVLLTLLVRELCVGTVLGLCASLPFVAARSAGALLERSVDRSVAQSVDRSAGSMAGRPEAEEGGDEDRSPVATFYLFLTGVLFMELSGPRLLLVALARSYEVLPTGGVAAQRAVPIALWLIGQFFLVAFAIAAPLLAALLLAQVFVALLTRLRAAGLGLEAGAGPLGGLLLLVVLALSHGKIVAILREQIAVLPAALAACLGRLAGSAR